ncbi:MAG: DUF1599 domain-containing protein [Saprospiraceae bacterium]|nr:DUF1599 domain-containing protein [Saprospiraceae bacterium]
MRKIFYVRRTLKQYDAVLAACKAVFLSKTEDYGTAWRILRTSSLTDQLYIKARRIRTIEQVGSQRVEDDVEGDYQGLVNYSLMALIQLSLPEEEKLELSREEAEEYYDRFAGQARELMIRKNHDYGEVWRDMRLSSLTDLILMKLLRIKQIEDNEGIVKVSEGLEANYLDIINYALFALIKLSEHKDHNNL